jgi:hypothetical protein
MELLMPFVVAISILFVHNEYETVKAPEYAGVAPMKLNLL